MKIIERIKICVSRGQNSISNGCFAKEATIDDIFLEFVNVSLVTLAFALLRKDQRVFCEFSVTYFSKRRNKFHHNSGGELRVEKAFRKVQNALCPRDSRGTSSGQEERLGLMVDIGGDNKIYYAA